MNSQGILTITVDSDGWLKLYTDNRDAQRCKAKGDVIVQLSLTKAQMATVIKAEMVAKQNKETKS